MEVTPMKRQPVDATRPTAAPLRHNNAQHAVPIDATLMLPRAPWTAPKMSHMLQAYQTENGSGAATDQSKNGSR